MQAARETGWDKVAATMRALADESPRSWVLGGRVNAVRKV